MSRQGDPFGTAYTATEPNGGKDARNYGARWTDEEKKQLERMYWKGLSLKYMCESLGRPSSGVLAKLCDANLIHAGEHGYVRGPRPGTVFDDSHLDSLGYVGMTLINERHANPCAEISLPTVKIFNPTLKEETMIDNRHDYKPPVIQTRTFIKGTDAANYSNEQIFQVISEIENEIKRLEAISNKPKKLGAQIEQAKQDIAALIAYVDGRE